MVDTEDRKSDTPRESLIHIIEVQLVYFDAVKTGKLEFRPMLDNTYHSMSKQPLLDALDSVDQQMFAYLSREDFDVERNVQVFWGTGSSNVIDTFFFLREHDILHAGWNLVLMDHLNMPRYPSLAHYWGE